MAPKIWQVFKCHFKRLSLYSDTRKLWSVTCIYLNQPPLLKSFQRLATREQGFLMCGQCLLDRVPGAVTPICLWKLKEASAVCFIRASPPLLGFHCQALHLNGQGPFQAHAPQEGKERTQSPPECQESEILTPGWRPHIWSDHDQVKREWVSTCSNLHLPSHCD